MTAFDVLGFFGELLALVVAFTMAQMAYSRVCRIYEALVDIRYYVQRLVLMCDKFVREDEARRKLKTPFVIDVVQVKV